LDGSVATGSQPIHSITQHNTHTAVNTCTCK